MRTTFRFVPLVALATLALGQTDGITVVVSRQLAIAPSEAQFLINIAADQSTTLEQIVTAVQPLGLTAQDLTSVNAFPYSGPFPYTGPPDPSKVNYIFRMTAPANRLKETLDRITRTRRDLDAGMELQHQMMGLGPTAAEVEATRRRLLPELLAEARKRAEEVAAAGSVKVGALQGVIDSSFASPPGGYNQYGPITAVQVYGMTVRFALQ
jgi:hypothetical protein